MQTRADLLIRQLLMEQFDTLPTQCRHTEHLHEAVLKNNIDDMTAIKIKTMFPVCSRKGLCL